MKVMTVVGARPNFMKAAPIVKAITEYNNRLPVGYSAERHDCVPPVIQHLLVHTGQHYDTAMTRSFFAELDLRAPDINLGVGSGSHAVQTGEIMRRFEEVLLREKPDVLVVVGDVNSTVACALAAAKICYDPCGTRPVIAHVEAGLRSFDRAMPEEINRVLTDQLSDLLFVTEESGLRNLAMEGVPSEKVHFVGNTMIDSVMACKEKAEASAILQLLGLKGTATQGAHRASPYALLTLHRPANVDACEAMLNILGGLEELAKELPIIFPAHPRTQNRIKDFGLERYFAGDPNRATSLPCGSPGFNAIRIIEPLGYSDFLCLIRNATLVVTDSGGIQEETTCLGIPCVTVRDNTERPVTVDRGTNVVAGTTKEKIAAAIRRQRERRGGHLIPEKWDGHAGRRIVDVLIGFYNGRTSSRQVPALQACI